MKTCYIYIHRRLDTHEVFYVGRGTRKLRDNPTSDSITYKRAYCIHSTKHWINLTNLTSWRVEILHDLLTWERSIELEKEYIKKYGRRDLGLGTLINLTDGGEGTPGWVMPEYLRDQKRERWSGDNNPNKKLVNKLNNSARMAGEGNPMKNRETAMKVVAKKKEAWANGRPNPLTGRPREDVRRNNLLNNPAKSPEAREKIRQARLKRDLRGSRSPVARKVLDLQTGVEYGSIVECAAGIGKTVVTVHNHIKKGLIRYV
jgi:hypothetical protein